MFRVSVATLDQAAQGRGRGLLMRYVATYNTKFSGSFHNELLGDTGASGYTMALRVLSTLHPSEPEMWTSLFKQNFPNFVLGGTMQPIVAPWPTMPQKPDFVQLYETCGWRGEDMSLLEFLRKSNSSGDVVHWLQKAHSKADTALDLAAFAQQHRTFGEKIIAAETVSIFNDKFFGQWLMLFMPFRRAEDFLYADIVAKVPERYRLFACALRAAPAYWQDVHRIREDLELAARKDDYIANALAMIRAQQAIVEQYLTGKLTLADEVPEPAQPTPAAASAQVTRPAFNREQRHVETQALKRLDSVAGLREAADPQEIDQRVAELEANNTIMVCLGAPGTGKTFVADYIIRVAVARGLRVLYALPTGQLACRMRQRHPDIEVDTCHGAFLFHRPLTEAMALLTDYDLVAVDEVLQLSAEEFYRMHSMFVAAGKQLVLLLMGDEWQLPCIEEEPANAHPLWTRCWSATLTQACRFAAFFFVWCFYALLNDILLNFREHFRPGRCVGVAAQNYKAS